MTNKAKYPGWVIIWFFVLILIPFFGQWLYYYDLLKTGALISLITAWIISFVSLGIQKEADAEKRFVCIALAIMAISIPLSGDLLVYFGPKCLLINNSLGWGPFISLMLLWLVSFVGFFQQTKEFFENENA